VRAAIAGPGEAVAESAAAVTDVHTPAIRVVVDAGHGGRDPGAIGRF
jgi:N-acetylmuramoyl-L-alanine amidase